VAQTWGAIAATAQLRGRPRPQRDTWIAACCIKSGLPLVTLNRRDFVDFAEHDGLVLLLRSGAAARRCGMQTTTTYLDRVRPAIEQVGERLAALVATAAGPDRRVPHSPDWTVREAAAHVVTVALRFAAGPERRGTWVPDPRGLPELNDAEIRALGTRGLEQLAERLRRDLAAVCDQVAGYGSAPPSFRFHGGEPVPADLALGILLGELVVHGWDIAQALRRPWPIDPGHVALIFDGLVPILPGWVDPDQARGLTATFEVRLRGQATHVFAFQDGRLQMNPERPRRVDAHVSADPATLLLVVYRRRSQWPQIAAGRLLAWGRRPWLALSFVRRFHQP
jgi:uncharacterized protein (TIGR03083 family)